MATGTIVKPKFTDTIKTLPVSGRTDNTGFVVDIGLPTSATVLFVSCSGVDQLGFCYKRSNGQYGLRVTNSSFGGVGQTNITATVYYID